MAGWISPLTACRFPAGGHDFLPVGGQIVPRRGVVLVVQAFDSLSGGGLVESEAVTVGDDDVCVVQESVDGRGGQCLGMISSKPDGWR
jgi:hypothetical protein